jgi:hypothetical protein
MPIAALVCQPRTDRLPAKTSAVMIAWGDIDHSELYRWAQNSTSGINEMHPECSTSSRLNQKNQIRIIQELVLHIDKELL